MVDKMKEQRRGEIDLCICRELEFWSVEFGFYFPIQKSANITPEVLELVEILHWEPKTSSGSTLPEILPRALAAYFNSSAPTTISRRGSSIALVDSE
jgi:hypothetical protein